ncbi:MAG: hypothetical protein FJ386_07465 [Verrucomicrobia bacterium]|nr:hypothetical protein [Verrucomicrobiota bacterium]
MKPHTRLLLLAAAVLTFVRAAGAADSFVWRATQDRVDADIRGWELPQLLEHIASATGWQVFVEPGTQLKQPVTMRFQKLPPGQALDRLLGDLSFGLVPQQSGPDKLLVYHTSRDGATQRVKPRARPGDDKRIPDELIVMLRPGSGEDVDKLAARFGAKVAGRADKLGAFRLQFGDEAAASAARSALLGNDSVAVENNYPVQRPADPNAPAAAGVVAPGLGVKPGAGPDSGRFIVALVDSPVQSLTSPYRDFILPTISVAGESTQGGTFPTHGTSMAETILRGLDRSTDSTTTQMRIQPVDVYGDSPSTTTFEVAKGVAEAVNGGASIVNLSLGSPGDSPLLHRVIKEGFNRGVLFTAAAGNEPTTSANYPAAYPEVLAVTARDRSGAIAPYANRGTFVDVAAPDSQVVNYAGKNYVVSGTSASTAYISGYAAGLVMENGGKPISAAKALVPIFTPVPRTRP